MTTDPSGLSACGAIVRRYDKDRYLSALFAPVKAREALFAVLAFNHEVAKTSEVVSESLIGQIRLQWWREALDGIEAGTPRQHEVVTPLSEAVWELGLSLAPLRRLIDAREADLEQESPEDVTALLEYCRMTGGGLARVSAQCLGASEDEQDIAEEIGIAFALVGLIRATPGLAKAKRTMIPRTVWLAASVDEKAYFALRSELGLSRAVTELAELAGDALKAARSKGRPRRLLPVLLQARMASDHLQTLAKAGHDPFSPDLVAERPSRILGLWLRSLLRLY